MEGESAIFAEIASGGSHVSELYEELRCQGYGPDEIRRGVEEAQVQIAAHADDAIVGSSNASANAHDIERRRPPIGQA